MSIFDLNTIITFASSEKWPFNRGGGLFEDEIHDEVETTSLNLIMHNLLYGALREGKNREPIIGAISTFQNGTTKDGYEVFTSSASTTATYSWTLTKTFSSTLTASMSAHIPAYTGGLSVSATLSTTTTETQSTSQTQTWSWSANIPVPAKSTVTAKVFVSNIIIDTDFSAVAEVSGDVVIHRIKRTFNVLGSTIKEILTERIQIGELISLLGEDFIKRLGITIKANNTILINIAGTFYCKQGIGYDLVADQTSNDIALEDMPTESTSIYGMNILNDQPVIGPPDGIHYTIIGIREVTKPAVICGFNDLGLPNNGKFKIETRFYEEYNNGKLTRSWTEDIEKFIDCVVI